jgi:hypothetical protein
MRLSVLFCLLLSSVATAKTKVEVASADGIATVTVDGTPRWRGTQLVSAIAWDQNRDAFAFTARTRSGPQLVVVLLNAGGPPETMTWPIPAELKSVVWLGPTRVAAGPTEFEPRVTASWKLGQR